MNEILVSICIPSYNRPQELRRLLESIDSEENKELIEIVVCEDKAPKREDVRRTVGEYAEKSKYSVIYIENDSNLGFDGNLRHLIQKSNGEYVIFMGDDDVFIENQLDPYINYIKQHRECGYILRSYRRVLLSGEIVDFKYFSNDMIFEPSDNTYVKMFDKSVFVSGFTIKRAYAKEFETGQFDGSLLYQLYLLAEVCRIYPSAYYHTPITQAYEGGVPLFGNSKSEKGLYKPGKSVDNNLHFMGWYVKILDYVAEKYQNDTNKQIKKNMSKYSYTFMSVHRSDGIKVFNHYVDELRKMGFGSSIFFYIYYLGLLIFGEQKCSDIINKLKIIIGHRPSL